MIKQLTVMPTGYSVPDSEQLSSVDFDVVGRSLAVLTMHAPDFIKSVGSFHQANGIKRYVDMEMELRASDHVVGKPPFKHFIKLLSMFAKAMEGITVNDWYKAQFESPYLSKIDKEFLVDFSDTVGTYIVDENLDKIKLDMTIARMNVALTIPGNRVKTSKQQVDNSFNTFCLKRYSQKAEFGNPTWDNYISSIIGRHDNKGYSLLIILMKAIFMTGYSDLEYQGG